MRGTLSEEQLERDWREWKEDGGAAVRERLICHYLPLVEFLADRLGRHFPPSSRGELYSFGVIGLMDAIDKFKPELGFRFETYGSRRIRGAMSDGMRSLQWLPRDAGRRASRVIEKIVPVDFQTACNPLGVPFEDCMADPDNTPAIEILELEADYEEVVDAIHVLPERERKIVIDHYFGQKYLAEIGQDLGVTESRVCQLHRRALKMLEEILVAQTEPQIA